jgi:hypothetical protein
MSIANQMKNLTDDILSSYKQRAAEFQERLKDNAEINKKVQETLDGFRKDQMEMATTLRASAASLHTNLEQSQKERLKSFKQMMGGIHGSISQIQSEVEEIKISTTVMLSDFSTNHKAAAAELHKELDQNQANLLSWNSSRLKDFNGFMLETNEKINSIKKEVRSIFDFTDELLVKFSDDRIKMSATMRAELNTNLTDRVTYTRNILAEFNKSLAETGKVNQEMAKALKLDLQNSSKELSNSDAQRLKDFNVSFTGIQKRVNEIQKYVNTFLTEFSTDRKQAAETWSQLIKTIARLEESPVHEQKKSTTETVIPTTEKVEVEKEAPVKEVPVKEVPVKEEIVSKTGTTTTESVAEIPKIDKSKTESTLEEKVLNYINSHKKGVKVSDMEKPFGETRMRLGFVSKKLLDEEKVQKIENLYYPLTKK